MTPDADADALPLVITDDAELLEAALRWCAAAGVTPYVTADTTQASGRWRRAPFVLVGQDCLAGMSQSRPQRRRDVHIVCHEPDSCWRAAVSIGAERVVTTGDDALGDSLVAAAEGRAEACVAAVLGGSGGAGTSTFASVMALEANRRHLETLAIDLDHTGGGLDTLLGCEQDPGVRWPDMADTHGKLNGDSLQRVLVQHGNLRILSASRDTVGEIPVDAMESVLRAASRRFDLIVVDVPRALGPSAQTALLSATATIVVVPEEIRSVAAARAVMSQLETAPPNPVLLARMRRGGIGALETARLLGMPLMGRLRFDGRIHTTVDHGDGPGRSRPLRRAARTALDHLGLSQ